MPDVYKIVYIMTNAVVLYWTFFIEPFDCIHAKIGRTVLDPVDGVHTKVVWKWIWD